MENIPDEVIVWIAQYKKDRLSLKEESRLKEWLDEHPEVGEEAEDIARWVENAELSGVYRALKVEDAWQEIGRQVAGTAGWVHRKRIAYWKTVAAVVLPLAIAASVLLYQQKKADVTHLAQEEMIRPGEAQAELWLANGEKIVLKHERQQQIVNRSGQLIGVDSSNTFVCPKDRQQTEEWNMLKIPVGGEYRLILSDGTKVWLNSESELKFPVQFGQQERKVELKGEAYFEVSPDKEHPFVVRTAHSGIRVLGTSFNVSCYENEDREETTLVEGKVEVMLPDRVYALQAGRQLELNTKDRSIEIKEVDTRLYASWKDGIFRFCDMPLEELAIKLQRWYNVNFFFVQDACRQVRFTGAIRKYADFQEFIRMIETTTSVKFNIRGNTVTIQMK